MKSLGDPAFFRIFDSLVARANPQAGQRRPHWSIGDTDWRWERHAFSGDAHSFMLDSWTITRAGSRGWSLLVAKEIWWTADPRKPLRDLRWAKLARGSRADAVNWLRQTGSE